MGMGGPTSDQFSLSVSSWHLGLPRTEGPTPEKKNPLKKQFSVSARYPDDAKKYQVPGEGPGMASGHACLS